MQVLNIILCVHCVSFKFIYFSEYCILFLSINFNILQHLRTRIHSFFNKYQLNLAEARCSYFLDPVLANKKPWPPPNMCLKWFLGSPLPFSVTIFMPVSTFSEIALQNCKIVLINVVLIKKECRSSFGCPLDNGIFSCRRLQTRMDTFNG